MIKLCITCGVGSCPILSIWNHTWLARHFVPIMKPSAALVQSPKNVDHEFSLPLLAKSWDLNPTLNPHTPHTRVVASRDLNWLGLV